MYFRSIILGTTRLYTARSIFFALRKFIFCTTAYSGQMFIAKRLNTPICHCFAQFVVVHVCDFIDLLNLLDDIISNIPRADIFGNKLVFRRFIQHFDIDFACAVVELLAPFNQTDFFKFFKNLLDSATGYIHDFFKFFP